MIGEYWREKAKAFNKKHRGSRQSVWIDENKEWIVCRSFWTDIIAYEPNTDTIYLGRAYQCSHHTSIHTSNFFHEILEEEKPNWEEAIEQIFNDGTRLQPLEHYEQSDNYCGSWSEHNIFERATKGERI